VKEARPDPRVAVVVTTDQRRVLPPHAETRFAALAEAQRRSAARRYVS
jgi:hypothetical protein